jgi:hypothetical protein
MSTKTLRSERNPKPYIYQEFDLVEALEAESLAAKRRKRGVPGTPDFGVLGCNTAHGATGCGKSLRCC